MECCRMYHEVMRMICSCTPPTQRVKTTNACLSFSFFGLFTAIFLSYIVDIFYSGNYGSQVKKSYVPSNCTLLSYSQIRSPSSVSESYNGLCIHRFEVLMLIPQPAGEEPQFQQTSILELTSGECTPESRKGTHWPAQNSNSPSFPEETGISIRRGKLRSRAQARNQTDYSYSNAETSVCYFSKTLNTQAVLTENELFDSIPSPPSRLPSLPFFSSIFGSKNPPLPQDHSISYPISDISLHTNIQPSLTTLTSASLTQPGGPMLRLAATLNFLDWFLAIILCIFPTLIVVPFLIWLPYLTYRGIRKIFCCCPRQPTDFTAQMARVEDLIAEAEAEAEPEEPADQPVDVDETPEQRRQRLEARREARRAAQRAAAAEQESESPQDISQTTPLLQSARREPLSVGGDGLWGGSEEDDEAAMIALQLAMIDAVYRSQGEQTRDRHAERNRRERNNGTATGQNSVVEAGYTADSQPAPPSTQTGATSSPTTIQVQPAEASVDPSLVPNTTQLPEREMSDVERARLARLARQGM
ncbi:hypothetical protein BLNAU_5940 [Blattamonas nauphoetae]|uniref:Uncharacterized protein n=1 Tax=Blattamonas nauphoetae TaxID=2049346 RepID=A0ABQ9Y5W7_9EUKA|nr:hypothetical protein BLNAU_5940 [Blattamonas nauphoetae]